MQLIQKTIFIVDDQPVIRNSIKTIIQKIPDYTVIGEAYSGDNALQQLEKISPDIVLMDITMGKKINGIQATKIIKEKYPDIKVAIFTAWDHSETLLAALKCGADGYMTKAMGVNEFKKGLDTIFRGQVWVAPSMAKLLITLADKILLKNEFKGNQLHSKTLKCESPLSKQEYKIFQRLSQGYSYDEIKKELNVNPCWFESALKKVPSNF